MTASGDNGGKTPKATLSAPAQSRCAPAPHERRSASAHPIFRAAAASLRAGRLDRRSFLRVSALLGVGTAAAGALALRHAASPAQADTVAQAATRPAAPIGGRLRVMMPVHAVGDPARAEWVAAANVFRHQYEHLTRTDAENITRPVLAERWSASDDLKTWSFVLRQGVRWRSGAALTAEDVAWNIRRWLDPETASSNASLFGAGAEVEIVDARRFRLHLPTPSLAIPEHLQHYPAVILPRDFAGDPLADARRPGGGGTGAYALAEHAAGDEARLVRVRPGRDAPEDWRYWGAALAPDRAAAAGVGPARLEEIVYRHAETGDGTGLDALLRGEADMIHEISAEEAPAADAAEGVTVLRTVSAATGCIRMRVDALPFSDERIRRALQRTVDATRFADAVFGAWGGVGAHTHVAPIHPEHAGVAAPARDVEMSRRLLTAAGRLDGADLELEVQEGDGDWRGRAADALAQQAAEAGFRIAVRRVSAERHRSTWKTAPFSLTHWAHRPLGTMALALGYRSDAVWNETGFADPAFDAALAEAEARLDIADRRRAMHDVERRLQDAAVIVQPFWKPVFTALRDRVSGVEAHPALHHHFGAAQVARA